MLKDFDLFWPLVPEDRNKLQREFDVSFADIFDFLDDAQYEISQLERRLRCLIRSDSSGRTEMVR